MFSWLHTYIIGSSNVAFSGVFIDASVGEKSMISNKNDVR